jgi:hypothetical protein
MNRRSLFKSLLGVLAALWIGAKAKSAGKITIRECGTGERLTLGLDQDMGMISYGSDGVPICRWGTDGYRYEWDRALKVWVRGISRPPGAVET